MTLRGTGSAGQRNAPPRWVIGASTRDDGTEREPHAARGGGTGRHSETRRLLVVDDEPLVARALRRDLVGRGFEVDVATGGHDALAQLEARSYAAVVTDARMPGMSGEELLVLVAARHPGVVRVLISGHYDIDDTSNLIDLTERKPWNDEDLARRLHAALDERERRS